MKITKMALFMVFTILISIALPSVSLADSVETIKEKEASTEVQGEQLSEDIQVALADVNQKYQKLEDLKVSISQSETNIEKTESDIEEVKGNIEKRKTAIGERLKSMQASSTTQQKIKLLLEANSLTDFINRAYAVSVLQEADKSKIVTLDEEQKKLDSLQTELKNSKSSLETQETSLTIEAEAIDQKVSDLKLQLADNQAALTQLSTSRQAEESRLAKEAAKAKEEVEEKQAQSSSTSEKESSSSSTANSGGTTASSNSSNNVEEGSSTTPPAPDKPVVPEANGNSFTAVSTGYSYTQPGLSFFTATGIDLRQNPMVVAVDPGVIPLGSIVEVPGYGIAIAGDTGGDIVGNRIDLHFKTVTECTNWGRRSVTITVR